MAGSTYTGGCFCGAIRFSVSGDVRSCCFCHCESCRRASGGAYVPWATFDKALLSVTQGVLDRRISTPGATRGHCPSCGTSLTYEHTERPDEVDIALVALDDPQQITPTRHIWVADKLPWVSIDDALPQHESWGDTDTD